MAVAVQMASHHAPACGTKAPYGVIQLRGCVDEMVYGPPASTPAPGPATVSEMLDCLDAGHASSLYSSTNKSSCVASGG